MATFKTLDDLGNVDREFAIAADELLGSVQWSDEKKAMPHLGQASCRDRLLRDHRHLGRQMGKALEDEALGLLIGGRNRRLVVLAPGNDLIGVVTKDDGAGVISDLGERAQHGRGGVGVNIIRHGAVHSPTEIAGASVENIFTIP